VVDLRSLGSRLTDGAGRPQLLGAACVRALSWAGTLVVVGTRAGEILTLDYSASEEMPQTTLLLQGHARVRRKPEERGGWAGSSPLPAAVAAHPSEAVVATAAADGTVRLWSTRERLMLAMRLLAAPPSALAFSPLADLLLVGTANGALMALEADSLAERCAAQLDPAEGAVRCLAFSPDGSLLAVGTEGGPILLFQLARSSLEKVGVLRGHTCAVVAIDWSEGGGELQSNSATHELLFWTARSCTQLAASSSRALRWASAACRAAWPLLGAVSRAAHPDCLVFSARSRGGDAVAVGHSGGGLSLHPYPCASHLSPARLLDLAHADGAVGLAWACDDSSLFSIGEDGALLQWRYGGGGGAAGGDELGAAAAALEEAELDSDVEAELARDLHPALLLTGSRAAAAANAAQQARLGPVQGVQGVAPFWGEIHAPSNWSAPLDALNAPADALELEWAYGIRSHDARGHAHWTASGEALFPAAAVGVVLDPRARTQRFCTSHSAEVLCAAMHPNKLLAATGQASNGTSGAAALVWDSRTGDTLALLRGVHRDGVSCVAFDSSGALLATVGLEPSHVVALWDWQAEASLLARVATGLPRVFALSFRPNAAGRIELAAAGVRCLTFLSESAPAADDSAPLLLRCRRGNWGRVPPATLLCVAWSSDGAECLTGSVRGDVLLWCERTLLRAVRAHAGPVHDLCASGNGDVVSAGRGGELRRWGPMLRAAGPPIDLRAPLAALTDSAGRPLASCASALTLRSVDVDARGRLLLATGSGELLMLDPSAGELTILLQGHGPAPAGGASSSWPGAVAGLATHPTRDLAVTAGDDATLRLWSLRSRAMSALRPLPAAARALAYSPDGALLAVGLATGGLLLLDGATLGAADEPALASIGSLGLPPPPLSSSAAADAELPRGAISELAWSPDGALLAAAASDTRIHLYAPAAPRAGWAGGMRRVGLCAGHAGAG